MSILLARLIVVAGLTLASVAMIAGVGHHQRDMRAIAASRAPAPDVIFLKLQGHARPAICFPDRCILPPDRAELREATR